MNFRKMKRTVAIVLLAVLLFSLYGCYPRNPLTQVLLVTQTSYAIPGARISDVNSSKQYEIIETDDYGRKLFAISFDEHPFITATCVMQKSDDQSVYYYDNVSYLCTEKFKSYSQEQIIKLKEDNDWNKPLDATKMIKREFVNAFSLEPDRESAVNREKVSSAYIQTFGASKYLTSAGYFDYSQTGQEIFLVSRAEEEVNDGRTDLILIDRYFMILNADGTYDPENYLIKVDDLNHSNEPLAEIKEKNGWIG